MQEQIGEIGMKFRRTVIFTGAIFQVPERIQRIDTDNTHGWQVRYGRGDEPTEMYSDFTNDGSGAVAALQLAIAALHRRIRNLPAPTGLRTQPMARKTTDLPVGISGPALRNANKAGKTPYYCYQVSVPLVSGGSTTKSVYIGTVNTSNAEREHAALAKAAELRAVAEAKIRVAKTKAKRAAAVQALARKMVRLDREANSLTESPDPRSR